MRLRLFLLLFVTAICVSVAHAQDFEPVNEADLVPITAENAAQIEHIQTYGQGQPGEVAWSPDGRLFAVADTIGVWLYDALDWTAAPQLIATFDWVPPYWDISWGPLVEFSPDGDLLAFSNSDSIRFWDVTGETELQSRKINWSASSIAFSPDGTQFVAGGYLALAFWNTNTWEIEKIWYSPQTNDYIRFGAIAFSPDGSLLATNGSYRNDVYLWDPSAATMEDAEIARLGVTQIDDIVQNIAFSADSKTVIAASLLFGVRAFNTSTLDPVPLNIRSNRAMAYSPAKDLLATANYGEPVPRPFDWTTSVEVHGWTSDEPIFTWEGHESVQFMAFSLDGTQLAAVSSKDGRIRVFDVTKEQELGVIHYVLNADTFLLSPDSTQLAVGALAFNGSGVIDIRAGAVVYETPLTQDEREQLLAGFLNEHFAYNTDGDFFHAHFTGDGVLLTDVSRSVTYTLDTPGRNVISTFSADGEVLVTNGVDLRVWSTRTGERLSQMDTERLSINQRAIVSPDGRYVALVEGADMSRFLRIWDTASGEIASELPPVSIFVFAFHPLRDVIAVAGRDNTISLWDIPTGQQLQVLRPSGFVALFTDTLTFSDGGDVLIFGGGTGDIRIWEWESGTVLATVEAHELAVIRVVLSDDETLMVTSDIDGNMALWDYPSMERLATVLTGPVGIESLVMTADKRMVFVLGTDGTIRIWGVPSTE